MQREIKFRGKRLDNGEWVYGSLLISGPQEKSLEPLHYFVCPLDNGYYRVIPETVGQYTGLKDKNGTEIYEGDIVNCEKRGAAFYRSVVVYNSIMGRHDVNAMDCMFPMTLDCCEDDISINGNDYDVIGNIYENLELLKEVSE